MGYGSARLVGRVRRLLRSAEPDSESPPLRLFDVAELDARVRRLYESGESYSRVGLSRDVARDGVDRAEIRVGGECVATDV